jgi:hypothetical protein
MNITIPFPNGSEMRILRSKEEINKLLGICDTDYQKNPNPNFMDGMLREIYSQEILPKEREILKSRCEILEKLFLEKLWKRIQEAESIDIAFGVIDEFIHE